MNTIAKKPPFPPHYVLKCGDRYLGPHFGKTVPVAGLAKNFCMISQAQELARDLNARADSSFEWQVVLFDVQLGRAA